MEHLDPLTAAWISMQRELRAFLLKRVPPGEVDDLVQQTWLRLRERSDPAGWRDARSVIFTTAGHLATDAHRHARVRARAREEGLLSTTEIARPDDPADAVEEDQRRAQMLAALSRLPATCRQAFYLCRFEGMTHPQIAARLGISSKTVQRYVERALRACVVAARS